jgi:membrane-associated phospholipid phosphatase
MEPMLLWGLDLIRAVQTMASPPLTFFMKMITNLGSSAVYLLLLPLIFWSVDEKKGIRLGLVILISAWINLALKFLFHQPRPFWEGYDPGLGLISERFGGLPSGHAQNSLVLWSFIASWGKKKWLYAAAACLILLVGFSRLYLGVHFPTDVFAGWLMGGLILAGFFLLGPRLEEALGRGGLRAGLYVSAAAAFIMILYRPDNELLMPGAALLGMGTGYSLNAHFLRFRAAAVFGRRGAAKWCTLLGRYALGIAGIALLFFLSGRLIPENTASGFYRILFFLRYALPGFWISVGAPWLFLRIGLAERG